MAHQTQAKGLDCVEASRHVTGRRCRLHSCSEAAGANGKLALDLMQQERSAGRSAGSGQGFRDSAAGSAAVWTTLASAIAARRAVVWSERWQLGQRLGQKTFKSAPTRSLVAERQWCRLPQAEHPRSLTVLQPDDSAAEGRSGGGSLRERGRVEGKARRTRVPLFPPFSSRAFALQVWRQRARSRRSPFGAGAGGRTPLGRTCPFGPLSFLFPLLPSGRRPV